MCFISIFIYFLLYCFATYLSYNHICSSMNPNSFLQSPSDPHSRDNQRISIMLIGHATVLINFYGTVILTDPILFDKIGIQLGNRKIGIRRLTPPSITLAAIPKIDYVVLSHAHMDHWDMESLHAITKHFPNQVHFICPRNTSGLLACIDNKKDITEIERHEEIAFGDIIFRAWETRHRWARRPRERYKTYSVWHHTAKWHSSYLISHTGEDKHIVFGWDTAYTQAYKKLTAHLSEWVDIAIMPIGAYKPWERHHCTPEQAVEMAKHMQSKWFVPIHFETFRLDQAHLKEPITRLSNTLVHDWDIQLAISEIWETFVL